VGKIDEKAECRSVFFDNMVLYSECRIYRNALLQTVSLTILPTGYLFSNSNQHRERIQYDGYYAQSLY